MEESKIMNNILEDMKALADAGCFHTTTYGPTCESYTSFRDKENLFQFSKQNVIDSVMPSNRLDEVNKHVINLRTLEQEYLWQYIKAINKIDDYFEYACESDKDQAKVHEIMDNLCKGLQQIK